MILDTSGQGFIGKRRRDRNGESAQMRTDPSLRGGPMKAKLPVPGKPVFLLFASLLLSTLPARADSARVVASLPTPNSTTSAVFDGSKALIFGGKSGDGQYLDGIARFDPITNSVDMATATLPTARLRASATWTGRRAYIFGGLVPPFGDSRTAEIVEYDPAADAVRVMGGVLPTARSETSAVWDPRNRPRVGCRQGCAYIFGGQENGPCCTHFLSDIVRYNPATDTVAVMSARLPDIRGYTSAVFDGTYVYAFGGYRAACSTVCVEFDEIVRYDPVADVAVVMDARLPSTRSWTSAVWDGRHAYVLGGTDYSRSSSRPYLDEIVRYDPIADRAELMSSRLPSPRSRTSAVWAGSSAYVFGGYSYGSSYLDEIVRYELSPGPPQSPSASVGPGLGETTVTWQPPASDTYSSPLTGYRIYRRDPFGTATQLAEVGTVLTFVDTTCNVGSVCYYSVSAFNEDGEGPPSDEVFAPGTALLI